MMVDTSTIKKISDLNNACRLCLQFSEQLTHVFDDLVPEQPKDVSLSSKIMACVSIEISPTDRGPQKICDRCMDSINFWYKFKENCRKMDASLQKFLNEATEQEEALPKVDDITNVISENSLLNEFSLSSFDSVFGKNFYFKSNLSSIFDVYLNGGTHQLDYESDRLTDLKNVEPADQTDIPPTETINEIPEVSSTEPNLGSESERLVEPRRKGYNCELCNDTFARFTNLLNHDDTVHQYIIRKYSCLTCGRLFISENRLKIHELSHREKSYKCTDCDKLFSSAKSLEVHSRLHSGKYKCSTCGFVSTSKLYLEEHLLKHMGNKMMYVCKLCSMSFTCRSSLLRHENIHFKHGGKVYRCSVCGTVTRRRSELQHHMAVHNSKDEDQFKCNLCSRSYKSMKTLRAHLLRHEDGIFMCKVCDKKLHSKYDLREHENTHSQVKQFPCFHCDKKFSFRSTLIKHLKSNVPRVRSDISVI